ncbi:neprilysin-1-like isoform X2 [Dermacentor albipictus]|uniref:neprilysin-1-like isoform X2 n=1 Tax=Dermacentor albipictus TaxID=60249 RepID=UPI0031FBEDF5
MSRHGKRATQRKSSIFCPHRRNPLVAEVAKSQRSRRYDEHYDRSPKTKKRRTAEMPVTSPFHGGIQSGGGVSQGGHSSLAVEIGSPYTPPISTGAHSPRQRPLARLHRAGREDLDNTLEGEPDGARDNMGSRSMANTTVRATTKTEHSEMPLSVTEEVPREEHPRGEQGVQPTLVVLAAMASACLAISLLTLLARLAAPAHRPRRGVCLTRACVALNEMLVAASNASVDPCDDFYGHVCGRWTESASVYEKHLSLFVDKVIDVLVRARMTNTIRNPTQQAAMLLQSCLAIVEDSRNEVGAFRSKLTELGVTWPHVNSKSEELIVTAARVFEAFRISPLLTIRKSRTKAGEVSLLIEPGDALPNWFKMRALLLQEGTYRTYYEQAAALYDSNATPTMSFQDFSELESLLIPALTSADHSGAEVFELDSTERLSHYVGPDRFAHLQAFLKYGLGLPSSTRVQVRSVDYMTRLQRLAKHIGEQRLEFYLGWCVVQAMWRFVSKPFAQLWYQSVRSALDTVVERPSHADCIELTESLLGWTVYAEFSRTHVEAKALDDVDEIARTIAAVFINEVNRGRWSYIADHIPIDKRDFEDVLFHGKRFNEQVLSDVFDTIAMNVSLLQNWMAVAKMNARIPDEEWREVSSSYMRQLRESSGYTFYDSQRSAVRIPPLFPMLPLYDRDSTVAAKYGAIGTVLGAAAVRLFVGRLPHNSVARTKIEERLACFAVPRSSPAAPSRVNQHAYLAAAVDLVWDAFASADAQASAEPGDLSNYTSDVTFFMVMCHLLCSVRASLLVEFSCNQVVKNSHAFARVFNCEVGRPMNPARKCNFFSASDSTSCRVLPLKARLSFSTHFAVHLFPGAER